MAGRIPQSFIDDLVAGTDIVEVVGQYVSLKRAGKEYKACCPFHDEKTPSFTVVPDKQFFHCFGCGAHGTAVGFLMDYANMEFVEAVEDLARRAGREVPREGGASTPREDFEPVFAALDRANAYYRRQLRHHPQASRAVAYLKARGLSGAIAKDFQLGYAPPGRNGVLDELGIDESARATLARAGLLVEPDDGRPYDRFRDRVTFPIHDHRGRVTGFGARVVSDGTPKYINSPETPVFHKGRELYGLWRARQAGRSPARLLVVEGYMDVVALAQSGIDYAVATLGTAATETQIQRMFRVVDDVVFCFDGDDAGRRAAWRAVENTLPCMKPGRQALFLFLPEGRRSRQPRTDRRQGPIRGTPGGRGADERVSVRSPDERCRPADTGGSGTSRRTHPASSGQAPPRAIPAAARHPARGAVRRFAVEHVARGTRQPARTGRDPVGIRIAREAGRADAPPRAFARGGRR